MNLELFLAKRIHFSKKHGDKNVSSPAIKIAVAGVAIGLAAMILSVSIAIGFKNEVRSKVVGFGSHIQISNFDNNTSYESNSIAVNDALISKLYDKKEVKHVELYANKPGIIKTDEAFQGVMLKGVGTDYNWDFFEKHLIEGSVLNLQDSATSTQALISQSIANKLNLKLGDSFINYFVEEPIRLRKFEIAGIFQTNFEEYDKLFVITDIKLIQRLNNWEADEVSGIEILLNDYDQLDEAKDELFFEMMQHKDRLGNSFFTRSVKDMNPMIINWLDLLDTNVGIIIVLMLIISVFTMSSGLLIIILERTSMIGMLKTLGARDYNIRKTFLYLASFLILKGMFWGNLIALSFIFLQSQFQIIKLDPVAYYTTSVPVDFNLGYILLLNIATLTISCFMMIAPSYLIARISPIKSIRFE